VGPRRDLWRPVAASLLPVVMPAVLFVGCSSSREAAISLVLPTTTTSVPPATVPQTTMTSVPETSVGATAATSTVPLTAVATIATLPLATVAATTLPAATVPLPTVAPPPVTNTTPDVTTVAPPPTGGRYVTSPSDNVRLGDTGPGVLAVQQRLITWGYLSSAADGTFGQSTRAAVVAFQRDQGLAADGVCGKNTWAILSQVPPDPGGGDF
jgi:hypothetical protein